MFHRASQNIFHMTEVHLTSTRNFDFVQNFRGFFWTLKLSWAEECILECLFNPNIPTKIIFVTFFYLSDLYKLETLILSDNPVTTFPSFSMFSYLVKLKRSLNYFIALFSRKAFSRIELSQFWFISKSVLTFKCKILS